MEVVEVSKNKVTSRDMVGAIERMPTSYRMNDKSGYVGKVVVISQK